MTTIAPPGRTLAATWRPSCGGSLHHLQRFPPSHLTARQWTARASAGQYITPVKAAGRLLHFVSPFGDWRDSLYSGTLAGGFYEGREGRDVLQAGLGGGSSATASAQSVRAAVARRLHRYGSPGGGCCSRWRGQARRRLHRRGQAVRLWLLGCSHRCDRPGGGCCFHWRGQTRRQRLGGGTVRPCRAAPNGDQASRRRLGGGGSKLEVSCSI